MGCHSQHTSVLSVSSMTQCAVAACICVYICYEVSIWVSIFLLLFFTSSYITSELLEVNRNVQVCAHHT